MTDSDQSENPADRAALQYSCPSCNAELKAPAALAGTSQVCPRCERTIRLPGVAIPTSSSPAVSSTLSSGQQIPDSARIRLNCPQCGQLVFARGHQLGSTVMCDNCLEDVPVSATATQQAAGESQDAVDSVDVVGLDKHSDDSDAEFSLEAEMPLEMELEKSPGAPAEPAATVSDGGQAIRLTPDDVVTSPAEEPEKPAAVVKPAKQSYDLENVDLENVQPTDPPLPSDLSLDGLEKQPAGQSTEEIMSGFQPAEGEASDSNQGPSASVETADAYQFGFNCGLCGTRMIVSSHQIGTELRCPDCHSETTVREPPQQERARRVQPPDSEEAMPTIAPAFTQSAPEKIDESRREQAQKVLDKANQELDEQDQEFRMLEERHWWRAIISMLGQFDVVLRIILLSIVIYMSALFVYWSNHMPTEAQTLAMGFLLHTAALVFAGPFVILFSTTLVTIVEQTADGRDDVGDWPGIISTEWMGTTPYFVVAVLGGAVPLIAWLPLTMGLLPEELVWSVASVLAGTAAAVVLLSTLSSGTALLIVSVAVISSIPLRAVSWLKFVGFVVLWGPGVAGGLALLTSDRLSLILLGCPLLILSCFLYARSVGVLGYQIGRYRDGDLLDTLQDSMDDDVIE